jgi:hypothetical protein
MMLLVTGVSLSAFFGVVSTIDFALLGLWWVAVQTRPDLRKHGSTASRMAYVVSLQFIVPGTASLLAQVDPTLTAVWRVSFAIAGATGIVGILLLVPELTSSGAPAVTKFLRFGALPLYALMTIIAITPWFLSDTSYKLGALQVEGILFCLVVFLGAQVAWAAAMSTDPTDPAKTDPSAAHRDRPPSPGGGGHGYDPDRRAEAPVPWPPALRQLPPDRPAGPGPH